MLLRALTEGLGGSETQSFILAKPNEAGKSNNGLVRPDGHFVHNTVAINNLGEVRMHGSFGPGVELAQASQPAMVSVGKDVRQSGSTHQTISDIRNRNPPDMVGGGVIALESQQSQGGSMSSDMDFVPESLAQPGEQINPGLLATFYDEYYALELQGSRQKGADCKRFVR